MSKPKLVTISIGSILKIIGVFAALYVMYLIRDVLGVLFVAIVLASVITPWVDWVQTKHVPRGLGIVSVYLIILILFSFVAVLIVKPIILQMGELSMKFPQYTEQIRSTFSAIQEYTGGHALLNDLKNNFGINRDNIFSFSTVSGIFKGVISFFLILVVAFYMVIEENAMRYTIQYFVPKKKQAYALDLVHRMQLKIGLWIRGQLILSFIIFLLIFFGLSIIGVRYALVLAFLAGLTEFIPYIGPILAAIPAVFLAFTQSPLLAGITILLYMVVQWTENNIIVPKIMQKVIGFNPVISITVLLTGFKIGGPVGAILAMPVATATSVFIEDLFEKK